MNNLNNVVYVSASTHPAKKDVIDYAKIISEAGADFMHCDVMDGVFVEDKTIGYETISKINAVNTIPLDVHLMVQNPTKNLQKYLDAGANILTVHFESYQTRSQLKNDLKIIRENKALCGISFKPNTDINKILQYLDVCDVVLVMGVMPGKSGQEMLSGTLEKVKKISDYRQMHKLNYFIEVDGGINPENCEKLTENGADILVSGNYLFNALDKQFAVQSLKR